MLGSAAVEEKCTVNADEPEEIKKPTSIGFYQVS